MEKLGWNEKGPEKENKPQSTINIDINISKGSTPTPGQSITRKTLTQSQRVVSPPSTQNGTQVKIKTRISWHRLASQAQRSYCQLVYRCTGTNTTNYWAKHLLVLKHNVIIET